MEKCTFYEIIGSDCGTESPPRKDVTRNEIIPLGNGMKNIDGNMKLLQLLKPFRNNNRGRINSQQGRWDLFNLMTLLHSTVQ